MSQSSRLKVLILTGLWFLSILGVSGYDFIQNAFSRPSNVMKALCALITFILGAATAALWVRRHYFTPILMIGLCAINVILAILGMGLFILLNLHDTDGVIAAAMFGVKKIVVTLWIVFAIADSSAMFSLFSKGRKDEEKA